MTRYRFVSDALQAVLDGHGWTQAEGATHIGISRYSVNQLLNERRTLTPQMAVLLEAAFPKFLSAEQWLAMETEKLIATERARYQMRAGVNAAARKKRSRR